MKSLFQYCQINDVVLDVTTWNPVRDGHEQLIRYIDLSSVDQDTKVIHPNEPIVAREAPSRARQLVQAGDVLVSTVRPNLNGVAMVDEKLDGATASTGFCILRPRKKFLDGSYLFHWVKTPDFISDMVRKATGASYPAVSDRIVLESKIPLPPIAEQKRIAAILDKAEELRGLRRQALEELDAMTQSIFLEMFGDPVKNDKNWQPVKMEDLMQIRRGASPRPIDKYLNGDVNWIKIGDGTKGSDIYLEKCEDKVTYAGAQKSVFLKSGSLIFANCGVSLGFARILKVDGCIHDGWLSFEDISEEKLNKIFLLKALNSISKHFRAIAPAGTQPNLNTGIMKSFRIILPPLPLQQEFARRVEAIEQLKATHRESLAQLDALFASLQHRAFRGEL